jgi:hypothetical protein
MTVFGSSEFRHDLRRGGAFGSCRAEKNPFRRKIRCSFYAFSPC